MVSVIRQGNESFESMLRRFKRVVQQERILSDIKRHRYYEKPSVIRKREAARKLRKSRRTTYRDLRRKY